MENFSMLEKIKNFANSLHFTNALKVTLATVFPVLLLSYFGHFEIGFAIALGAFFTYPSDIPSSLEHKIKGIVITAFLVAVANILVNLIHLLDLFFYPLFGILIFLFSMISVYGQRATAVSFSCLLSSCLAISHWHSGWDILLYAIFIFAGGLFYLFVSLIFYFSHPYRTLEIHLASCINLTAKYLKLRADLWKIDADKQSITEKQLALQIEINHLHETIRNLLIDNQSSSSDSGQNRKLLIVFVNLVEILELALSTAFDHKTLHEKFDEHPYVIKSYTNLAVNLKKTLKQLSKNIARSTRYRSKHSLLEDLKQFENAITTYEKKIGAEKAKEGVMMLTTMLDYGENQVKKIKSIERAFNLKINEEEIVINRKDLEKFLTPQYYPISTFINNLSFSSSIFRHSIRITTTLLFGFFIASILPFQNVFWILLTIIVIMRPGYGLTKERSFQRIFGTVLGGCIAFGFLYVAKDNLVLSLMAILCLLLGMSFTNVSYKTSATFVTMYVVFLYSILTPNSTNIIEYRIIDTAVGAALAFLFNHFIWPNWEFINTPKYIEKAIFANRNYLKEIANYYNKKGPVPIVYKIARKNAFIEIGNLMASFQRMKQEPKSKQIHMEQVYKLTVLNHTLLSSIASMGTYIQSHTTTAASSAFNSVTHSVLHNLEQALIALNPEFTHQAQPISSIDKNKGFSDLMQIKIKEITEKNTLDSTTDKGKMQEAHLIIEQLEGLINLSESILKNTQILVKKEEV